MIIASCKLTLYLPAVSSLKEKRSIIKSLIDKSRNKFNIAVAEVDKNDYWQSAVIGAAAVGNSRRHLESLMDKYINFVESLPDSILTDFKMEII
ncbi:MAG: DUF503 domain-containing protein [Bacillota bacterium]